MPASPAALAATGTLALCLVALACAPVLPDPGRRPDEPSPSVSVGSPRVAVGDDHRLTGAAGGTESAGGSIAARARTIDDLLPGSILSPVTHNPVVSLSAAEIGTGSPLFDGSRLNTAYRSPVTPAVLIAPFEAPPERWDRGHRGVDLAASPGDPVHAPADGVVVFAGTVVDRGVLTILHPDGLRSSLEPLEAEAEAGAVVAAGAMVGRVSGPSHCAPGSCLHWGVRQGETYRDPLDLLESTGPTVLLPIP